MQNKDFPAASTRVPKTEPVPRCRFPAVFFVTLPGLTSWYHLLVLGK
jgi:hypothetical protein